MRAVPVPVLSLAATLVLAAACAPDGPSAGGPRYVSIGADALDAARAVAARHGEQLSVLDTAGDVAVLALDEGDLEALSEQMHARHGRCGGFMLHDSLDDARASLRQRAAELAAPAAAAPAVTVDYTLDQAAAVHDLLPALDAARIHATIAELSAMKNRYYQSDTGAAASLWLRDRWRSFTSRSDVTVELVDHGYAQKSVILTIPGTTRASEVVVIGGHLDSIALGGRASTAPGADDDASGIATLTEVARALLAADVRPARTLQLIAYAAEEVGLRGSLSIVRDYKRRGVNVVGVLQLDMTNYQGSDLDIWLIEDFTSRAQNAFLGRLIDTYVGASWGVDVCGYACSDHASWHRAGVPASMPFESRSSERNRTIHTARDTLETSGDNAAHALKFARLAAAYAVELGKPLPSSTTLSPAPVPAAPLPPPSRGASGHDVRALLAALGLALALGLHVTATRRL
jgi:leucyl aminopeptidase